jgi:hypothetical protein
MVTGRVSRPVARRIAMQAHFSRELVADRIAEIRRAAEVAQLARDVKQARRQRRGVARLRPVRTAQRAGRPEHAGLGAR